MSLQTKLFPLKSIFDAMHVQVLELENLPRTHVVCTIDSYSTNRWSQFYKNFDEYAFIVNLASIRSLKGYNVAWFTVLKKIDY
jgi:hypothetical protein